jgi:hypothetical protein
VAELGLTWQLSERHVAAGNDEERLERVEHAPKLLAEGRVHLTRQ